MAHLIEALCEPRQLFLAWQSPNLDPKKRYRWAVGLIVPRASEFTLHYFRSGQEFEEHNQGRPYRELADLGYAGYPAFDPAQKDHEVGVRAALMRRLPPRQRSDFGDYLRLFHLPENAPLSDLSLLGRTEATLPSDGFSLVDPLDGGAAACDVLLEVAGYRHYAGDAPAAVGEAVEILREPDNSFDPDAVELRVQGIRLGYVNRLQARAFHGWLEHASIDAWVERLNGTSERPRAFIFVRVRPSQRRAAA